MVGGKKCDRKVKVKISRYKVSETVQNLYLYVERCLGYERIRLGTCEGAKYRKCDEIGRKTWEKCDRL
jgi:hypothetical protein